MSEDVPTVPRIWHFSLGFFPGLALLICWTVLSKRRNRRRGKIATLLAFAVLKLLRKDHNGAAQKCAEVLDLERKCAAALIVARVGTQTAAGLFWGDQGF